MRRVLWFLVVAAVVPGAVVAQESAIDAAAATITEGDFAWRVGVIAHDSMQGRNTPSPGLDKTAEWVASEFRRFGLKGGAGAGSFIQRYPLIRTSLDLDASGIEVAGGARLSYGGDVLPAFGGNTDVDATGSVAVISGALESEGLDGSSLSGRHVVVILDPGTRGNPPGLFGVLGAAARSGAVSVILSAALTDEEWATQAGLAGRSQVRYPGSTPGGGGFSLPLLLVRAPALAGILASQGLSSEELAARSAAKEETRVDVLADLNLTLTQRVSTSDVTAPNVVGILEGSDPALKDEYVVFSGHMDHIGIGVPDENGDSIFNGADDDASGTVAVMEVAEAMASLPTAPRRSTIFLVVSGEEKGLFGSRYYSENPSVPVDQLVADLNTDMVGRNWPDTIVAIGKEHSDLGATLNRVNAEHPELRMTAIDDIWPEENFYSRSDHFNFAQKGVPILFFFNGTHEDYHGLDDEPDRIDAEKAARIARLVFYLGMDVANADERPKWNPESYKQIVSD